MKESQFHAYQRKHGKHEKNQSFTSRVTDFFFFRFSYTLFCLFPVSFCVSFCGKGGGGMRMVMAEAVVVVVMLVVIVQLPGFLHELKSVSSVSRACVRVTEYVFDGSFLLLCIS